MEAVKKIIQILVVLLLLQLSSSTSNAVNSKCFITIVNPVRGKNFWRSTDSVNRQINFFVSNHIPATWLLQYSLLIDNSSATIFQDLPQSQERGVFLEVDENLANDSVVPYKYGTGDWARSDKVLLSGYLPSERKRMIDKIFDKYKSIYGIYPSSVGAWYIDSLSLGYMSQKYHIKAVLEVSDQYQTDTYGIWGQPWGNPYMPSLLNTLIPSQEKADMSDFVVIQWAQRDPMMGYGLTVSDSTYSMQANDYISAHKLDISYFRSLSQSYLYSGNLLNQVTLGLEAGQEGAEFGRELENQVYEMKRIVENNEAKFVTMTEFSDTYRKNFPDNYPNRFIQIKNSAGEAYWYSTSFYRIGLKLIDHQLFIRDLRVYNLPFVFEDSMDKESNPILKRIIPSIIDDAINKNDRLITGNIDNITVENAADSYILHIKTYDKNDYSLLLAKDKIIGNGKTIVDFSKLSGLSDHFKRIILSMFGDYILNKNSDLGWNLKYSVINGISYAGIMYAPDSIFGFKTKFPYIGFFKFPFQTLIYFKGLPELDLITILGRNFIKYVNNSTINKVSHIFL